MEHKLYLHRIDFFYEEKGENSQYHKDVAANQAMVLVRDNNYAECKKK